jgi:hypothetical protein
VLGFEIEETLPYVNVAPAIGSPDCGTDVEVGENARGKGSEERVHRVREIVLKCTREGVKGR